MTSTYHQRWYRKNRLRCQWNTQRNDAKQRGIRFLLTFDEWLHIWTESGHMHEKGRFAHQYQMCRFNDQGAYKVGNVIIQTCRENRAEQRTRRDKHTGQYKSL